jgi:two-component system OmpR family sensor kinase
MARTADAIASGDLSHRVDDDDTRTEAGRLGAAINSMLDTIEIAFHDRAESEASVRRFAADASHELRTPLTSIRGYLELWEVGGLRDDDAFPDALRRVRQEATRMGSLVEDLPLLTRLDHHTLERVPVRIDQLAHDAVQDARAVEPSRVITVRTERAVVLGDEMRLRQVFANLLANARVHTPPDGHVDVAVVSDGPTVRIEVGDEGPGIPPDAMGKVFERFYRAEESRSRSNGGSGLGLAIVAAIAEAHGGTASVTSTVGAGSRFVVALQATSA